jgi:nucleoid-associated protein YgaU
MTSDAKIGLLLGLIFIFVIAFIINGLPRANKEAHNSELTTNMIGLQDGAPGIGAKERRVQTAFSQTETAEPQPSAVPAMPAGEPDTRFMMPLPRGPTQEQQVAAIQPTGPAQVSAASATEKQQQVQAKSVATQSAPAASKVYVVQEGDSLSSIAKKVYGADAGNKLVNLNKIFEANRSTMKSPDELYVGQKLVMPALPTVSQTPPALSGPQFEKVESIGARHAAETGGEKAQSGRVCTVKDGDTMWKIAQKYLGDGNRYDEIAKLNADTIADEDTLDVGMTLKLPAK